MALEVGSIVDGKIVTITKFGAFVDMDGKTGMIHISEVASAYVKDIRDFLTEGQEVRVKVISVSPEGKISLSIKQLTTPAQPRSDGRPRPAPPRSDGSSRPAPPRNPRPPRDFSRPAPGKDAPEPGSFEDMMSRFKASSDDKMNTLKRRSIQGGAPRPRGKDRRWDD